VSKDARSKIAPVSSFIRPFIMIFFMKNLISLLAPCNSRLNIFVLLSFVRNIISHLSKEKDITCAV